MLDLQPEGTSTAALSCNISARVDIVILRQNTKVMKNREKIGEWIQRREKGEQRERERERERGGGEKEGVCRGWLMHTQRILQGVG